MHCRMLSKVAKSHHQSPKFAISCHELSKVVKSWQKLLSKVGKSCQKLAKTVPFLGYIVLWEDLILIVGKYELWETFILIVGGFNLNCGII